MDEVTARPAVARRGEGEARWWFGALAEIKLTAADTGGALSIVEITEPAGTEAPLHVHHRDDETFVVLEGSVTFQVGEETIAAGAGDIAFGPRRVPHRYDVGPDGCRMLFLLTPGGFEDLVREMSVPAETRTLPPALDEMPDMTRIGEIARRHACDLLM